MIVVGRPADHVATGPPPPVDLPVPGQQVPVPLPNLDNGPFYEFCKNRELRFQKCSQCGAWRHYPRPICPYCQSGNTEWVPSSGRGTIYITASKLWFMVTGAAIYFVLPRLVSPANLGVYKVVIGLVSVINAVVVTGTVQTVSKFVSQTPELADAIKRKALLLQCVLGGGAAVAFALAAPLVATALNDASLTPYLRLAALITASYAFYTAVSSSDGTWAMFTDGLPSGKLTVARMLPPASAKFWSARP